MMNTIGFLGLGAMGMPMACNLVKAGYTVSAWDPRPEARSEFAAAGGTPAESQAEAISHPIVLMSLPHNDVVTRLAKEAFLPGAFDGQVYVDFTTVIPREVRRLAVEFADRGARYLDCPVTGGPPGVRNRDLRIYAGGDADAFAKVRPLLDAVTAASEVYYCGESGAGQAVKGVNQIGMGLLEGAALEAVAYGIACGVSPELLADAVGGDDGFRAMIRSVCKRVSSHEAKWASIKYDQFEFFLDEAKERGFSLPVVAYLEELLANEPKTVRAANMDGPSYWDYLANRFPESAKEWA